MMRIYYIILAFAFGFILNTKAQVELGTFPIDSKSEKSINTEDFLERIDWNGIQKFSNKTDGHYAYVRKDSLITEYEYVKQGRVASIEIKSFNGFVLEYLSENTESQRPSKVSYFDKQLWIQYVNEFLPDFSDSFKISIDEPVDLLRSYYYLVGVDTRDEYGWICEYSTVGMATERRRAVIELIKYSRKDLLLRLLNYPNTQTQLYAADALIYMDYINNKQIAELSKKNDLMSKDYIDYIKEFTLQKSEWDKIYNLRDSGKIVVTCGNAGSYKIYQTKIADLLSEKAISEIPKQYELLQELGYFH